jgi:hypothetical protein
MDVQGKRRELEELRDRARQLELELDQAALEVWRPTGYYTMYYATTGFMLGIFGAAASLLFNIVGSLFVGQHPLELIRVYLTFPLGDSALQTDTGLALAVGCCLYLATGMLLGIPFYLVLTWITPNSSLSTRLVVVTVLSLAVWVINFYGILWWLQPLLIDMQPENEIVRRIPPWVAALTHLVFGWTMALVYPWGLYVPYRRPTEQS